MTDASHGLPAGHSDEIHRLMALATGDEKHEESSTSTLDAVHVLYDRMLRVDPVNPRWEERDGRRRIGNVGVPRRFIHTYGQLEEHDRELGLDTAGIRERIAAFLDGR